MSQKFFDKQTNDKWLLQVDIFVSSPSDLQIEREAIVRVIEKLNRLSSIRKKYVLKPLLYENEVVPEMGDLAQIIVDRYMSVIDSYIVICMLWARMGTPFTHPDTDEVFLSGTEYEFTIAYKHQTEGEPHILLYRKTAIGTANEDQKAKVDLFFKKVEMGDVGFRGLYSPFSSTKEFEELLFVHIDKMLDENPPKGSAKNLIDAETRPDIAERSRRLDVAMPKRCRVNVPTEVQVMICLPDSEGLRAYLPDYTVEGDLIDKRDVETNHLAVGFPVNKQTGRLEGIEILVEVIAHDFVISEPRQITKLSPDFDSGKITFSLIPQKIQMHSRVHISIKTRSPEGYVVTLGSGSLITDIKRSFIFALPSKAIMTLLSIPLGSITLAEPTTPDYNLLQQAKFGNLDTLEILKQQQLIADQQPDIIMSEKDKLASQNWVQQAKLGNLEVIELLKKQDLLQGQQLSNAHWNNIDLRDANLKNADLEHALLRGATLQSADLSNANLSRAMLDGANLRDAKLMSADLRQANMPLSILTNANMADVLLYEANLSGADMRWTYLAKADMRGATLQKVDLTAATLTDADLHSTDLWQAQLTYANLQGARLQEANLQDSKLVGANLSGANLMWANLANADLTNCLLDTNTILPDSRRWREGTDTFRFTDPQHPSFFGLS